MNNNFVNRVPHIILIYWVIKIASTTLGETGADMFSMTLNLGYGETIIIFMSLFLLLLAVKLRIKKYNPVTYWAVFTATAIVGTGISDFIDRTLGLRLCCRRTNISHNAINHSCDYGTQRKNQYLWN